MKGWPELRRLLADRAGKPGGALYAFDFDGTLSPLARRPSSARLPSATRELLKRLGTRAGVKVAVLSGRNLDDIKEKVGLPGIFYSGNHGLEIAGPGLAWRHPRALAAWPDVRLAGKVLGAALDGSSRALLEDKGFTLAVHYRGMAREQAAEMGAAVRRALRPFARRLTLAAGKKCWDIRPRVAWGKGQALLRIHDRAGRPGLLLFAGDDRTDEEAFRLLGHGTVTVRIGPGTESAARFRLPRQKDVPALLRLLCEARP